VQPVWLAKSLQVLAERNFISDADELIPLQKDLLKRNLFNGNNYSVVGLATAVMQPNIALFSAGGETSLEWAPKFAAVEPLLLIILLLENGSNKKN
jgi:aspartate-semialdehyde dehydrogenase